MDIPYKIVKEIGGQKKRKFGKVYLVSHIETGNPAIMKIIFKNELNNHLQDRLRKEAEFSFDFKGLPKILEFHESEKEILFIKDYQQGLPLLEFWEQVKNKDRFKTLITLLEGLEPIFDHLKANNIVHCDLKPSNILIHNSAEGLQLELIDFGLALNTLKHEERKILFPLGYAAPELILNHLDIVDQRTDLFSLGITICRLFSGKLPLTSPNPSVFTNLQITYPLPECQNLNKEANQILSKMCNKHVFRNSPNNMSSPEVRKLLLEGMNGRYNSLHEIILKFKEIVSRKPWYRLI